MLGSLKIMNGKIKIITLYAPIQFRIENNYNQIRSPFTYTLCVQK